MQIFLDTDIVPSIEIFSSMNFFPAIYVEKNDNYCPDGCGCLCVRDIFKNSLGVNPVSSLKFR
jgi:hypothetical protein